MSSQRRLIASLGRYRLSLPFLCSGHIAVATAAAGLFVAKIPCFVRILRLTSATPQKPQFRDKRF
jgi:hypothetical protein